MIGPSVLEQHSPGLHGAVFRAVRESAASHRCAAPQCPTLAALQGLIWEEGYGNGELKAVLFLDVVPMLERWAAEGGSSASVTQAGCLWLPALPACRAHALRC